MNAQELIHNYRKAIIDPNNIKSRERMKRKILSVLLIGILINAMTLIFFNYSMLAKSLSFVSAFFVIISILLFDFCKEIKIKERLIKAKFVGSLSEIFDMTCPYTNEVLNSYHIKIKNHVSKHSGIKGSLILELEATINELKEAKLNEKETKIYQDLYDLHTGKENERDLVFEDKDLAKVKYFALRVMYNNLKHKFSTNAYIALGIFAFPMTLGLGEELLHCYSANSLSNDVFGLIKVNLGLYFCILMVYLISRLPPNRISNKRIYEVFDLKDTLTKEMLLKQFKKLSEHAYVYQGYQNKFLLKLKKQILKEKANRLQKQEQLEREKILIASGTKLGDLISDVNNLA